MNITSEALRTFRTAAVAVAIIFSGLASYASIAGGPEQVRPQNEAQRFMSSGLHNAESRLAQELNLLHPVGSDAGSLLGHLARGGFDCQADLRNLGSYVCTFSRPLSFQRVARLGTTVNTSGRLVTGISPSLRVTHAPAVQPSQPLTAL